jgi:hypothetical protein
MRIHATAAGTLVDFASITDIDTKRYVAKKGKTVNGKPGWLLLTDAQFSARPGVMGRPGRNLGNHRPQAGKAAKLAIDAERKELARVAKKFGVDLDDDLPD